MSVAAIPRYQAVGPPSPISSRSRPTRRAEQAHVPPPRMAMQRQRHPQYLVPPRLAGHAGTTHVDARLAMHAIAPLPTTTTTTPTPAPSSTHIPPFSAPRRAGDLIEIVAPLRTAGMGPRWFGNLPNLNWIRPAPAASVAMRKQAESDLATSSFPLDGPGYTDEDVPLPEPYNAAFPHPLASYGCRSVNSTGPVRAEWRQCLAEMLENEPEKVKGTILASSAKSPLPPVLAIPLFLLEGCSIPERVWSEIENASDGSKAAASSSNSSVHLVGTPGGRPRPSSSSSSTTSAAQKAESAQVLSPFEGLTSMRTNFSHVARRTSIEQGQQGELHRRPSARHRPSAVATLAYPKTEMCDEWKSRGKCPTESTCLYAHGLLELRPPVTGLPSPPHHYDHLDIKDITPRAPTFHHNDRRASCAPRLSPSDPALHPSYRRSSEPHISAPPSSRFVPPPFKSGTQPRPIPIPIPNAIATPAAPVFTHPHHYPSDDMPWLNNTVDYLLKQTIDGDVTPRANSSFDCMRSSHVVMGSSALASPTHTFTPTSPSTTTSPTCSFAESHATFHTSYSTSSLSSVASGASGMSGVSGVSGVSSMSSIISRPESASDHYGVPASWSNFSLDDEWDVRKESTLNETYRYIPTSTNYSYSVWP